MPSLDFYHCVREDFDAVNLLITQKLDSKVPLVETIGQYIVESGGKRLRPLTVLLVANALGIDGSDHQKLAAVIEFLHTATLLHDDVVDSSDLRRGKSTANAKWGNSPSILVGDFLYSRAFQMMVELDDMAIMSILSNATNLIAEGEVQQLVNIKNANLKETQYFEVITRKTATLFSAATHSAAVIASGSESQTKAMRDFGEHLGIAFQLIDDALDYEGNAEDMGKNVGDDLAEGKMTLPLIFALKESNLEEQTFIRKSIREGEASDIEKMTDIVQKSGALAYTRGIAETYRDKALGYLDELSASVYKEALISLTAFSINRTV